MLWGVGFGGVLYYEAFYQPGDLLLLNSSLFCLHYVFVPKINAYLSILEESWINHKLSCEHGYTPM